MFQPGVSLKVRKIKYCVEESQRKKRMTLCDDCSVRREISKDSLPLGRRNHPDGNWGGRADKDDDI